MYRFLRRPRWIAATLSVLVIASVLVRLGVWQLDRHNERRVENAVLSARLDAAPEPLDVLIRAVGDDLLSLEYRNATIEGEFDHSGEVLLRGQAHDGLPGFDLVTPFVTTSGSTVLVNRGWVPLAFDTPPVAAAAPPQGPVNLEGVIRLSRQPSGIGPIEPAGTLTVIARVDLDRLSQQFPRLAPVWIELTEANTPAGSAIPGPVPAVDDAGPHMAYAIQWFGFAITGLVGFGAIVRRASRRQAEQ